ncbi:MAG: S8 family peptidase [Bacteroidota bacterium]
MVLKKGMGLLLLLCSFIFSYSQTALLSINTETDALQGWHLKDKSKDGFQGISLQQAYELLKGKKSVPIIVAVIDSGIDTLHEDLKPVLWRNAKEIPGNGKDDDKNGYTDDVHGWNFLGGKDGKNVNEDSYEAARVYHRLKIKYAGIKDTTLLNAEEKNQYKLFIKAQDNLESGAKEAMEMIPLLRNLYSKSSVADSLLRMVYKAEYNGNELIEFKPNNSKETDAKYVMISLYKAFDMMEASNQALMKDFKEYYEGQERKAATLDAPPPAYRANIVNDNYNDLNDKYYGNNDIMASHATHGTHVSGIIAAARNNGVGIDGVADNVRIMTIRAVPDGDEHDKDIALGIRYAVDNGAKVINMSFGKSFSPEKKWVDDAVKYAMSKDVLLVHAAGNDGKNIDETENYPNPEFIGTNIVASNFITVGASGDISTGGLAADFSNYGKNKVDVFAPGVKIYSSVPGGNTYAYQQGTSMASPVVAGIAALLRSYYPDLSAEQIRYCIENSVVKIDDKVSKPGTEKEEETFSALSKSGGIVNAYEAVKLAATLKPVKKAK